MREYLLSPSFTRVEADGEGYNGFLQGFLQALRKHCLQANVLVVCLQAGVLVRAEAHTRSFYSSPARSNDLASLSQTCTFAREHTESPHFHK